MDWSNDKDVLEFVEMEPVSTRRYEVDGEVDWFVYLGVWGSQPRIIGCGHTEAYALEAALRHNYPTLWTESRRQRSMSAGAVDGVRPTLRDEAAKNGAPERLGA